MPPPKVQLYVLGSFIHFSSTNIDSKCNASSSVLNVFKVYLIKFLGPYFRIAACNGVLVLLYDDGLLAYAPHPK